MRREFDLVILGSGFAGSLLAMIARRLNLSVALVERGSHPRFAIGESTSPLANLLLTEFAKRYDLPRIAPLAEYGSWIRAYPEITRGLKRGFSYYHHRPDETPSAQADRRDQLLVAASPNDEVADTHWLRSDVDLFLAREAERLDVEHFENTSIGSITRRGGAWDIDGERGGISLHLLARFLVDATGPRGALHRALGLKERVLAPMPPTQTLYSHFTGVRRTEHLDAFHTRDMPPYPADDAALHHVFDGGWMWVLRFDNGITSAGVMLDERLSREFAIHEGVRGWQRFLQTYPSIREQFAEAEPIRPFTFAQAVSFRSARAAGDGWALLPSAAGFVDPIFSTGIPLTLLGIERLARMFAENPGKNLGAVPGQALKAYEAVTLDELDAVARFVAGCYAAFDRFPLFAHYSMFYFAAASFSEMARRLNRHHLVRRFLAIDRPEFAAALDELGALLRSGDAIDERSFAGRAGQAIAPLNVAGLADPAKRNWYGVDVEDTARAAHKLESTPIDVRAIFA